MADWYFRNRQSNLQSCPGCRNLVRTDQEFCPYCARRLRAERSAWGLYRKVLSLPFIGTHFLLGLIILVFLLQFVVDFLVPASFSRGTSFSLFNLLGVNGVTLTLMGSNRTDLVLGEHEYWRLLTSCFLHMGIVHIIFNGMMLRDLGRVVERLWGAKELFAAFVLTGIGGSLARTLMNASSAVPVSSVGASGAICGLLGIMLGAYWRGRYHVGEMLGSSLIRSAVYIIAFGLIVPGIDNAAHVGGMLSGVALGYFLPPTGSTKTPKRDAKVWTVAAAASAIMLLLSFCFAAYYAVVMLGQLRAYMG